MFVTSSLYRHTTVGYWFCTFATNSFSRRTVVQINLCPPHSVPCATRHANLPASTKPPRHRGDCAKGARKDFSQAATGRHPLQSSCNPRRAKHIKPQRFDWCLQSNGRARAWIRLWSLPAWTVSRVGHNHFPLFQTRSYQVRDSFLPTVRRLQCRVLQVTLDVKDFFLLEIPRPILRAPRISISFAHMVTTTVTFTDRVSKMSSKLHAALMLPSNTDARSVCLQITAASNGHCSMALKL